MPIHDWNKVDAGIFHAFHLHWLSALSDVLNRGLLPSDCYALPEQYGAGFQPDVLTLEVATRDSAEKNAGDLTGSGSGSGTALVTSPPKLAPTAETAVDFYRRKQNSLVIRHISGDRMIAVIEVVSPGNKSSNAAIRKFIEKSSSLVLHGVHLLIVDLFPPGPRDPHGLHGAIWDDLCGEPYLPPTDKPLAAIAYEADEGIRAFVQHMNVGEAVPEMPLFLARNVTVTPPLDETYRTAFSVMPLRWRKVLESTPASS